MREAIEKASQKIAPDGADYYSAEEKADPDVSEDAFLK